MFLSIISTAHAADSLKYSYAGSSDTSFSLLWSSLKLVLALGFTVVLLVFVIWMLKKILEAKNINMGGGSPDTIKIIEIRYLSPKKAIALVKIMKRVLIVGFTEENMSVLGELSPEEIENMDVNVNPAEVPFKKLFEKVLSPKKSSL